MKTVANPGFLMGDSPSLVGHQSYVLQTVFKKLSDMGAGEGVNHRPGAPSSGIQRSGKGGGEKHGTKKLSLSLHCPRTAPLPPRTYFLCGN